MKKVVFMILAVLFSWTALAVAADQFQIERPEWKIGDRWVWEVKKNGESLGETTLLVTERLEDGYVAKRVDNRGKATIYYDKDFNVKEIFMGNGSQKFNPCFPMFFWPLKSQNFQKFYSWRDDTGKIRIGGRIKTEIGVAIMTDVVEIYNVYTDNEASTGAISRLWREEDTIIYFSKVKNYINRVYKNTTRKDGFIYEYSLISFEEGN